ncbi:hypothetical protein D3C72_2196300 [compost metagenome]
MWWLLWLLAAIWLEKIAVSYRMSYCMKIQPRVMIAAQTMGMSNRFNMEFEL